MARERERLYITVPHLFRCPISLDVMKSPVTLCTGVTYDRSSIQRWLDSGHDTCPATMQPLPSKDFLPNLTLRRLISQSSSPPLSPRFIHDRSLPEIARFLADNTDRRRFVAGLDGFVERVSSELSGESAEMRRLELAVKVLSLILGEDSVKEKLNKLFVEGKRKVFVSILRVLQDGDVNSKIQSVAVLEAISINEESKRIVWETPNLVPQIVQLIDLNDSSLNYAVLSFLISVSTNNTKLVELGIIGIISKILNDKNAVVSVVEKSLKLLTRVATCKEGRRGISEDAGCAGGIVERLLKVSKTATEDGVLVLWGMCCWLRCGKVQEKVVKSNGLTKALLVMQSVGDEGGVRRMCGDLVKLLKPASTLTGLGTYQTNTTHIMPS